MSKSGEIPRRPGLQEEAFTERVRSGDFPCLGAKAAVGLQQVTYVAYEGSSLQFFVSRLAADLEEFTLSKSRVPSSFAVFAAEFTNIETKNEEDFEKFLWSCLQGLHQIDQCEWDQHYSGDPQETQFKFSFAGFAFYVVGLHPFASRTARKFSCPILIFNPVWQFELLRERGMLDSLISKIRRRDQNLQGSINPNLRFEGILSDAIQYSGRAVDQSWQCPFKLVARGGIE